MSIDTKPFDSKRVWRGRFDASRVTWREDSLPQLHRDEGEDRLTCLRDDDDAILARSGLFHGVEPSAVAALSEQLQPIEFPCGQTLFVEGEPGDRLFIIITGKVKIGRQLPDGRRVLLTLMGPSDLVGTLSTFDPGPRTSTATTVTEVRAVSVDRNTLRDWIADRPEITEVLLRLLARRLRRTHDEVVDLMVTDVPGRVAKLLLKLAHRFGIQEGDSVRVDHDLTQEEIAQLVGASRETVNKTLADFAHRGWIRPTSRGATITNACSGEGPTHCMTPAITDNGYPGGFFIDNNVTIRDPAQSCPTPTT